MINCHARPPEAHALVHNSNPHRIIIIIILILILIITAPINQSINQPINSRNINPSKYVTRYHEICGVDPMDRAFAAASDWALDLNWPTCNLHFKYSQGDADAVNAWDSWAWDLSYLRK